VIYKYGDVDNVVCYKNMGNSTKYLEGRDKKRPYFQGSVTKFLLRLLVKIQDVIYH
jgi:hypothetical protein